MSAAHLFTAIDHVGIAVPDLDVAIAFYETTYGMRLAHQEVNEEQGVREAMMAVGDSGSCIQLLAPLNESRRSRSSSTARPGIQQMAYRVTDVEAVSAILRERGLRLLYDEPRAARRLADQLHPPQGRRGVLVELVEPAALERDPGVRRGQVAEGVVRSSTPCRAPVRYGEHRHHALQPPSHLEQPELDPLAKYSLCSGCRRRRRRRSAATALVPAERSITSMALRSAVGVAGRPTIDTSENGRTCRDRHLDRTCSTRAR